MRDNAALALRGRHVVLVPYTAEHVPRYHEWMASEELQRLTASEPLSLEAEFEMQQSWRNDADKCTFIVLAQLDGTNPLQSDKDEIANMAGDVNLFLNDPDEPHTAEVEIMIAEPKFRRRGLAREAILMMLDYGERDGDVSMFAWLVLLSLVFSQE
ncbi:Nat9 protein [Capsaspora owczarzaki ATCC 30864]|uniref:Nat9 protein n=1 Tax=Capsaspora owczarzaki (strain ATCC 30864) TaxID=595528 RepID=A0A0D2WP95_CAPO3|nr:Nat9 protein [Capsaspora owczarzaki ATCC 30864]